VPFNDVAKNLMLDALDETATAGIDFIGIHTLVTAPPTDTTPGTGTNAAATEATGGSPAYARLAVVWGASASGQKSNTGALTFDVPAGTYGFFGLYNALTGNTNTFNGYIPFGGASAVKGFATVDAADVTANTITSAGHGLVNTDRVIFYNVFAESLPTGITEGGAYFVVGATTDTFQIALTSGGAAVDLTAIGEAYFQKVVPEVFGAQGQITVAAGALVLDATGV
jgi:hypothetical protein